MIFIRTDWQDTNRIAKHAKKQVIDINNTVKAIEKFRKQLIEISKFSKSIIT